MTNEALSKGKVEILPEKTLKRHFLKIFLLGILIGYMLSMAVSRGDIIFMLAVFAFGLGTTSVIFKS